MILSAMTKVGHVICDAAKIKKSIAALRVEANDLFKTLR
jgi:hypothetical protein